MHGSNKVSLSLNSIYLYNPNDICSTLSFIFENICYSFQVWIYEHVPSIVGASDMTAYPRLFRWGGGYLPKSIEAADKMLEKLAEKHVQANFYITDHEKALLEQQCSAMLLQPEQRSKHREVSAFFK